MKNVVLSLVIGLLAVFGIAQDTAPSEMMTEKPEWQTIDLRNAATSEAFTLAAFEGKTVFVEPFATWCGSCRRQLTHVINATNELDNSEDVVVIALSVAENVSDDVLAEYAEENNFTDITFASASPDLLASLIREFGRSLVSPPATPHFIIKVDGSFSELDTGMESSEEILEQLYAALPSGS